MAQIYKTNGEVVEVEPKNGKDFKGKELNKIVGGYFELVQISEDQFMVVNEEGKLNNLPFNEKATDLYQSKLGPYDYIVGDCLVCKTSQIK